MTFLTSHDIQLLLFWIGFNEELVFSHVNKEDKKAAEAGELPEPKEAV